MTTHPVSNGDGLEVVVGADGSLSVPADELARHGVRPRCASAPGAAAPAGGTETPGQGALADSVDVETLDAFEAALAESKADRVAAVERRWA